MKNRKHIGQIGFVSPNDPDTILIPSQTFDTTPTDGTDAGTDTTRQDAPAFLGEQAMRIIFDSLREQVKRRQRLDNEYHLEWGPYLIVARHIYESHSERGGDHYCGIWEQVETIDRDELEIVYVYNVVDGTDDYAAMNRLTNYQKQHAL